MTLRARLAASLAPLALLLIAPTSAFAITINENFKPQDEFKLDKWLPLKVGPIDFSINKAVVYVWLAAILTCWTLYYVAKRMEARPNRIQTAVEMAYDLTYNQMTRQNMRPDLARKWFPFIGALFMFIWFSNVIGYLPLPINSEHPFHIFGVAIPSFAFYAATANLSIPFVLTLMVWFSYHVEGVREKGFGPYLKSWIPAGVEGPARAPIFVIEVISHFVRIISLSVRLFANLLAGHMLILFMAGGLGILLGFAALNIITVPVAVAFYLFELLLIATLQAFIFAVLAAIYIGGATSEAH